ncbi:MAG: DUF6521 family protein [Anaerolineae bacterium]|nr:DUF6521 family protein [Anaerolineae bacterium]
MTINTNAGPSFLGYLYQMEYALFLLLKAEHDEAKIAIEYLDDVNFSSTGTSVELFQLKHHISHLATLTDYSPDLWKSIRAWSDYTKQGYLKPDSILSLVTTAIATPNSISELLKPTIGRDNKAISEKLLEVSYSSNNQTLEPSFDAYQALSDKQRETLIASIRLLDGEPHIDEMAAKIKPLLQVRHEYRDQFYTRLYSWWFERVKLHVIERNSNWIAKAELINQLSDLNVQFHPQALPIDFRGVNPPEPPNANTDQRLFVKQLKEIMLTNREIEIAIVDYYRAFEQRSRWEREQLLHIDELKHYEQRLFDEWERFILRVQRQPSFISNDEIGLQSLGREIFDHCQGVDVRIRDNVTEPYVRRGSFHILANEDIPRVWWHPEFVNRLQAIIQLPEILKSEEPLEITNLFNAPFSTRILRESIKGYQNEANKGMPYALVFLVLPIVLHKPLRESLPRSISTKMHVWLRENQHVHIQFPSRARNLLPITKEGIMFGMHHEVINLADNAEFSSTAKRFRRRPANTVDTEEVERIEQRAHFVGRWFAQAGSATSIYMMWRVQP